MTTELTLVADSRQAERSAKLVQNALRPQLPSLRPARIPAPLRRPFLSPIVPRKDVSTMTSFYFGNQSQLVVAETKHQEMVHNAMVRQQLRDAHVNEASLLFTLRSGMANVLFALAQVVKPAGEHNAPATPRPAA